MSYPQKWTGSVDKYDKTGVAEFEVMGDKYVLNLKSFADFQTVSKMLDIAFEDGETFVKARARSVITKALSGIGC